MVRALMCLELIFNAININFVTFSNFLDSQEIKGEVFAIFIIAIAAAEAAIGLSIILVLYRNGRSNQINEFNLLKW
jgi:NADH:ubiquinone oxidoreductase subunit K